MDSAEQAGGDTLSTAPTDTGLIRELGLYDSAMMVAGSMIGSGIFIVAADIGRITGSAGWMLACWVITGLLTVAAAVSYGELAGMMPQAGGQYVYLREAFSPLWGFLFGWAFFLVVQSGSIAAVAIGFSKYLGVLFPAISPTSWIIPPIHVSHDYALSLSVQQLVGVLSIVLLTYLNMRGLKLGKWIQNIFTSTKTLALIALIVVGLGFGWNSEVVRQNFADCWTPKNVDTIKPDLGFVPAITATMGAAGLFIAICVAQVGSLFSADAWNNVTFTSAEVKNPRRNVPLALALGAGMVVVLYLLANVAYLVTLPMAQIQTVPDDRVATASLQTVLGGAGAFIMAIGIVISTFGCNNGLILAGARVCFAMARDGLFFRATGRLNRHHVPGIALVVQAVWSSLLILPRTRLYDPVTSLPKQDQVTGALLYGNLYSNLLDYVMSTVLIFYVLTIIGIFVLRRRRPNVPRPIRAFGYPVVPALYIVATTVIIAILIVYKTQTTWPGLTIVITGIPVYLLWRLFGRGAAIEARDAS